MRDDGLSFTLLHGSVLVFGSRDRRVGNCVRAQMREDQRAFAVTPQ